MALIMMSSSSSSSGGARARAAALGSSLLLSSSTSTSTFLLQLLHRHRHRRQSSCSCSPLRSTRHVRFLLPAHHFLLPPPGRISRTPSAPPAYSTLGALHSATLPPLPHPPPASSSSSSSSITTSQESVLLSSKEYANGDILFTFGEPPKQSPPEDLEESCEETEATVDAQDDIKVEDEAVQEVRTDENDGLQGAVTDINVEKLTSTKNARSEVQTDSSSPEDGASGPENEEETNHTFTSELESEKSSESVCEKPNQILKLRSGGALRPHPDKVSTGGEDAYVIEGMWAGVADGVGGWALSGVDSGIYSRELMANCRHFVSLENGIPNPKSIIIKSVAKTKAVGTCTAVLAALHDQTLYVANVGDSGFIVVRNGDVFAKSMPMQRGFNFPYQIGSDGDDPSIAETFEVPVASGDVLILATDGVYDNLYEREIVDIVVSGHSKGIEPNIVATWLVKLAHQAGLNSAGRSPFSDAAQAAGYAYEGGKLDDATVVVAYIE